MRNNNKTKTIRFHLNKRFPQSSSEISQTTGHCYVREHYDELSRAFFTFTIRRLRGGRYVRTDGFPTYVDDDGPRKDRTRPTSCPPAPVDRPNRSHPRKRVHERRTRSGPILAVERPPEDRGTCGSASVWLKPYTIVSVRSPETSTADFGEINACARKTLYRYFVRSDDGRSETKRFSADTLETTRTIVTRLPENDTEEKSDVKKKHEKQAIKVIK